MTTIEKVTVFITCTHADRRYLLLIQHPYAGIQLPAGTVDPGEAPAVAARREAAEETGFTDLSEERLLGQEEKDLPDGLCAIMTATPVYSRPDATSFDWIHIRRGIVVKPLRQQADFTQIHYQELDRHDAPDTLSFVITGWAPTRNLVWRYIRYFYHFTCQGDPQASWTVETDNHTFRLFWADVETLPALISPQQPWLDYFRKAL